MVRRSFRCSVLIKSLIIMTTLFIKTLLSSLCQIPKAFGTLSVSRGARGDCLVKFNFETHIESYVGKIFLPTYQLLLNLNRFL